MRMKSVQVENTTIIGRPSLSPTSRARIMIPAAHGTARRNAGVVGMPEPHLAARTTGDALGNGRAAVFLERGRIKHAVGDALALLALGNALADFLGMQF